MSRSRLDGSVLSQDTLAPGYGLFDLYPDGSFEYGYLPYWTGQQQTLNESLIPYAHKKYENKFIIQEPMQGIPQFAVRATYYIEDKQNTLVGTKKFGEFIVQQRLFTKENGGNTDKYSLSLKKSIEQDVTLVPQFSCDNMYAN